MEAAPDTVEAPPYDMEVEDIADSEVRYFPEVLSFSVR